MSGQTPTSAEIIASLLEIARVAMPEHLFAIDPRVLRAQALLQEIGSGTSPPLPVDEEQVPFFVADPADPTTAYVLEALGDFPTPRWDITEGLDAFMQTPEAPSSRSDAIVMILREWLTANGYLQLLPAKEEGH